MSEILNGSQEMIDTGTEFDSGDFSERLCGHFEQIYPDVVTADMEELGGLRTSVERREAAIEDKELLGVLEEYGIDSSLIELGEDGYYHIKIKKGIPEIDIPDGYGLKGGAARSFLLKNLGIIPVPKPRDVDIIRLVPKEPRPGLDNELAEKYMGDDFQFGYGVEVVTDLQEYFKTRDLTLNELIVTSDEIITTRQCLLDTVRGIIRVTDFERELFSGRAGPKMLAKALRFYAEAIYHWDTASLVDDVGSEYEEYFIPPFWWALQMDRAYESGSEIAELLISEMKKRSQLPDYIQTVPEAANFLSKLMSDRPFYYRHAPTEQFDLESQYEDYDKYPTHLGFGRGHDIRS